MLSGVVSDVYSPTRRSDLFAFNHRSRCIAEGRFGLHLSGSYEHSHGPVIAHSTQLNLTLGIARNNQPVNATASQGLLDTAQTIPKIRSEYEHASDDVGPIPHLVDTTDDLPNRMTAKQIIHAAAVQSLAETLHLGAVHWTMVIIGLVGESSGLPPRGPCAQHRHNINSAGFKRPISTDSFKTLSAKDLAGTRHVLEIRDFVMFIRSDVDKTPSDQPQARSFGQSLQQE